MLANALRRDSNMATEAVETGLDKLNAALKEMEARHFR
jgi:signal transduction histidine kinase